MRLLLSNQHFCVLLHELLLAVYDVEARLSNLLDATTAEVEDTFLLVNRNYYCVNASDA